MSFEFIDAEEFFSHFDTNNKEISIPEDLPNVILNVQFPCGHEMNIILEDGEYKLYEDDYVGCPICDPNLYKRNDNGNWISYQPQIEVIND